MAKSEARMLRAGVGISLALMAAACASQNGARLGAAPTTPAPASERSRSVVEGDESGFGIAGPETPPALKAAAAAPYAIPIPADCAAIDRDLAGLEALLGPDVDVLADPKARASMDHQASQALGSALRGAIPYRWALRWMTGAGRLDRELRQAVLAGTARRGFLKGMRLGMSCPRPAPDPTPQTTTVRPN